MYYQSTVPVPIIQLKQWEKMIAWLVLLSLLLQSVVALTPQINLPHVRTATTEDATPRAVDGPTPAPLPYDLPAELVGKPEVPALRTMESATFDLGNGQYARIQETQPLHYQDSAGNWQRINPAFQSVGGRWINSSNTVRTALSADNSSATLNTAAIALHWQPQALEWVDANGKEHKVAHSINSASSVPNSRNDAIRFQQGWRTAPISLPLLNLGQADTIEEQWQSRPGSVEYTMRLAELPSLPWWQSTPEFLDLRVQIELQPGTVLKIDGQVIDRTQEETIHTQNPISFVDAQGQELILHAPTTY